MRIEFTNKLASGSCDAKTNGALVVCVGDKQSISSILGTHDTPISADEVSGIMDKYGFAGEFEKVLSVIVNDKNGGQLCLLLVGLGNKNNLGAFYANRVGTVLFEQLQKLKRESAAIYVDVEDIVGRTASVNYIKSMANGLGIADFSASSKYKTVDENAPVPTRISRVWLVTKQDYSEDINSEYLEKLAASVKFVKELCVTPSNLKTPEMLSEMIKKELEPLGVEVSIKDEDDIKKLGMNAMLSVGQGSVHESRLVVMRWKGGNSAGLSKDLALVGKGVTFDTGGISIKPSRNMEDMKFDMSGAAAVVGAMRMLAARSAKINAVGVVGFVENMPSGSATRPGDVVRSMSGKTIEVLNTDAEGRVLLADLLWYTQTICDPVHIVDLATLTGAITVALGHGIYGGLFSNDDDLADLLLRCGQATGERFWRLPLDDEYDKAVSSDIADIKNTTTISGAGAITAAHFLMRFINQGKSWAHLDIAGMAYRSSGLLAAHCRSVGFGVYVLDTFAHSFE